jgi:hypothetical protein
MLRTVRPLALCAAAWLFYGCQDPGSSPVLVPDLPCQKPDSLVLPRFSVTSHPKDTLLPAAVAATLPGTEWAKGDSVRAFFAGKEVKLVFTLDRKMYLLRYGGMSGEAELSQISRGDESMSRVEGSINSPLFSPDGKKIVFAGTTRGQPGFVLDAVGAGQPARRVMLDQRGTHRTRITADPHFVTEGDRTWIYFASLSGLVSYSEGCDQIPGGTYKVELLPSGDVDTVFRITGIPGAYRGGVSRNGRWAGTSYATSALFDAQDSSTIVLAGGEQQCNPSMNPYPPSATHTDYMMILAFGGQPAYHLITGDSVVEGLHENLWIYNKDDKVVWRAKRPDENLYERYDKPEWSTHPGYATAVALRKKGPGAGTGDLYVIKIGDIMNAAEGPLREAEAYLKIGSGGFTSDSYSHLWVEP